MSIRDEYDMAFAPATEKQVADIEAEFLEVQKRNAALGDEVQRLARKLKALQAQQPNQEMIEAGREYVFGNERSNEVAFYPAMNTIRNLYKAMREAV